MIVNISKLYTGLNTDISYCLEKDKLYNYKKIEGIDYYIINNYLFKEKDLYEKYDGLFKSLNLSTKNNLYRIIGKEKSKDNLKKIVTNINNLNCQQKKYLKILKNREQFISNFSLSKYNNFKSKTGRVTIDSGINFLTLKKESRLDNYKKVFSDSVIFEVDIISLEPNILFFLNGKKVNDIYSFFQEKLSKTYERKNIKIALISLFYGSSIKNVKNITGLEKEDIVIIKRHLGIEDWENKLKKEYTQCNNIHNYYGRIITNSNSLINHYFQSTAADCAQLSFLNYFNSLDKGKINPIAFIHDSVIFECKKDYIHHIKTISHLKEDIIGIKLPVKIITL